MENYQILMKTFGLTPISRQLLYRAIQPVGTMGGKTADQLKESSHGALESSYQGGREYLQMSLKVLASEF